MRSKARRAMVRIGGGHRRELSLGVFVLAFRVSFCVQSGAGLKTWMRGLAGGTVWCESGCLCALAPHGAGDCLPRHDPQSIALFCVASGCFRSQNRHCSWRPGAKRAKGGQRWPKPDLSYIPATYFVSASVSMERVKGIEPSFGFP